MTTAAEARAHHLSPLPLRDWELVWDFGSIGADFGKLAKSPMRLPWTVGIRKIQ